MLKEAILFKILPFQLFSGRDVRTIRGTAGRDNSPYEILNNYKIMLGGYSNQQQSD